jgi:hypothetical protein
VYVFLTLDASVPLPADLKPIGQFLEVEGMTYIVEQAAADRAHLHYQFPCRLISLAVHSDLSAVGLLATLTAALTAEGISVNVISAFYHDHLFVPCDRVDDTLTCLKRLTQQAVDSAETG